MGEQPSIRRPLFFGLTLVNCERGSIRQSPNWLFIYAGKFEEVAISPDLGTAAELIELRDALRQKRDVFPCGELGLATLADCLAIQRSSREQPYIQLEHP